MILRNYSKIFCVIVVLLISSGLQAQLHKSFKVKGNKVNIDSLDKNILEMMDDIGIPGLSFAVFNSKGVLYSNSYGFKTTLGQDKVDKHTVFEMCSLSKNFVSFVAYQLVDEGKLDLDKPLYEYLENPGLEYDPRYKLITARMVLSHCSGIENWLYMNDSEKLDILSNPGEEYVYSGEGYNYLADVMEKILGQPFLEYMDERLIKPLKLKDTYSVFETRETRSSQKEIPCNYAIGHNNFNEVYKKRKWRKPNPAAAAHCNATDYVKYFNAMFSEKYLSKNSINDVLTPVIKVNKKNENRFVGTAFGLNYCNNDTLITFWGSNAGFRAQLIYSVAHDCGFVFFSNHERGWTITSQINDWTTNICVDWYYTPERYHNFYPCTVQDLLNIYINEGEEKMFLEIESLYDLDELDAKSLLELGEMFRKENNEIALKIFKLNAKFHPESADANGFYGTELFKSKKYDEAYNYLVKAKSLNFDRWEIQDKITECEQVLSFVKERNKAKEFYSGKYFNSVLNYTFYDNAKWDIINDSNNLVLGINTSDIKGMARLGEYALIKDTIFDNFKLKCLVRCPENLDENTAADYAIIFGFKTYKDYCYISFSNKKAEKNGASGLYKVIDGLSHRVKLEGTGILDNAYHQIELIKEDDTVIIKMDNQEFISIADNVFDVNGQIGFGSNNDQAYFDDIEIEGR